MSEENPLHYVPDKTCSKYNKSGRPKNQNVVKFSPQPRSLISQMLTKLKHDKFNSIISECLDSDNQSDSKDFNEIGIFDDNGENESIIEPHQDDLHEKCVSVGKSNTEKNLLFPCDFPQCKYISKLSSNLTKHKRTHTMEKPYLCDQCSFRSNFVNSLKVHKRIHGNERPFSCTHCSYRCNSSSNLKKHCKHRHWDAI